MGMYVYHLGWSNYGWYSNDLQSSLTKYIKVYFLSNARQQGIVPCSHSVNQVMVVLSQCVAGGRGCSEF